MDENTRLLIREWRRKADHDRGMAKLAIDAHSEFSDGICFHSEQAAEKDLKAICILLNIDFKRIHDLAYLLDIINEKEPVDDNFYDFAEKLQQYAVEVRYPEMINDPTYEEAIEAYDISLKFRNFLDAVDAHILKALEKNQ
jgi:HEPN domain-containing protein